MARNPRIPAKAVKDAIARSVAQKARAVFEEPLTDALLGLKDADWSKTAKTNPEAVVRALKTLTTLAGFVDRSVHETHHYDIAQLAQVLPAQLGIEKAREVWAHFNLPLEMLAEPEKPQGETIEHDPKPVSRLNVAK